MKLKKFNQEETIKYWDTKEDIDIPEYQFKKDDVRGCLLYTSRCV